jgi:hypothetical protein
MREQKALTVGRNLMGSLLKFNRSYFALAIMLFAIEILIATFAHDRIIRPYIGDVLVVILIYCFVKSVLNTPVLKTAICVLLFSFAIEGLQYLNLVDRLGLQNSKIATTIIGNSFEWIDIFAYIVGTVLVLFFEKIILSRNLKGNVKMKSLILILFIWCPAC